MMLGLVRAVTLLEDVIVRHPKLRLYVMLQAGRMPTT